MATAAISYVPDLLELHFEELGFLWRQRHAALNCSEYLVKNFLHLEERLQGHVGGILAAGKGATQMLQDSLAAEEGPVCFAASYSLLKSGAPSGIDKAIEAFLKSEGERCSGFTNAFSHAASDSVIKALLNGAPAASPLLQVAVAEVVSFRSPGRVTEDGLQNYLKDAEPKVRAAAWRVASLTGCVKSPQSGLAAVLDEDRHVRAGSLLAVAWSKQPWLLDHCRRAVPRAKRGELEELQMLAILGKPEDLPLLQKVCRNGALGPERFDIAASFGHPAIIDDLLAGMRSPDPVTAAAAGAAFTRITGVNITSSTRVQLPPAEGHKPDEFEKEFLDEVNLPDVAAAETFWQKRKSDFAKGMRWAQGINLTQLPDAQTMKLLDMRSRNEAMLRANYEGAVQCTRADIERFPQP